MDPPRSTLGLTAPPRRRTYATRVLRVDLSRVGSARVTSGAVNGGGARVKCACRFYSSRPIRDSSRWVLPADLRTTPTTPTDPATDVDVDVDGKERDGIQYDERGRRGPWRMNVVAAIRQAHARGLTAPDAPSQKADEPTPSQRRRAQAGVQQRGHEGRVLPSTDRRSSVPAVRPNRRISRARRTPTSRPLRTRARRRRRARGAGMATSATPCSTRWRRRDWTRIR